MLIAENRPRTLKARHAAALLFGDWGTSRLYVLGLAFYYTGHASLLYLTAMSVIMAAVAWGYTIVCRSFPEGGGVYAAARHVNPTLSVIGATLLLGGYIITASLSAVEGFHYFGLSADWVVPASVFTIALLGMVNWLGARSAGRLALAIAVAAVLASAVVAALCLPLIPAGLRNATLDAPGLDSPWTRWESLVRIVLALSGVEAVANLTGLMRQPVARTARRTIWPVLIEVIALNLLFAIALNALPALQPVTTPDYVTHELRGNLSPDAVPAEVRAYRDTAVKLLAEHSATQAAGPAVGRSFGIVAGVIFGLLLLSAVNTAIMAMVSVLYSMGRDGEVPRAFTRLNYSGVPWVGLVVAGILPLLVLLVISDAKALGELYAIGVVGAIAINMLSCAWNSELVMAKWERAGLWALGGIMSAIELTIIVSKPNATIFAGILIAAALGTRAVLHSRARAAARMALPAPPSGWLEEIRRAPAKLDPSRPRIMLAARGRYQSEFAVDMARRRNGVLFAIYVRTLRLIDVQPGQIPSIEDDPGAQEALGTTATLAARAGVPFFPIYVTGVEIADEILDYTVTYGCDTLIMGKSRRSVFSRKVVGDVLARVAAHLPDNVSLITRATDAVFVPAADPRDSRPNAE
ncbi:MAG: universal stress protein [Phycisphaerales bacterium]